MRVGLSFVSLRFGEHSARFHIYRTLVMWWHEQMSCYVG